MRVMLEPRGLLSRMRVAIARTRGSMAWYDYRQEGTMASAKPGKIRAALERIKQFFRKEPDNPPATDPYAYVTAPKRPRPSNRSAAAVAEIEE
jgi:hypothetical protein